MAKKPKQPSSTSAGARRRGRPPKPGGRIPQVEVQRAYRARLAAAGKVVRIVDASAAPLPPAIPDYDPAIDGIYERATVEKWRQDLRNALLRLKLREQDVQRLEQRNAYLEGELRLQAQHHTNTIKDKILLQQEIAALRRQQGKKPKRR